MSIFPGPIALSFYGALIAGIIGIFTSLFQDKRRLSYLRQVIITGISDDLNKTLEIFKEIENEWDKTKKVWFFTVNQIKVSRGIYDRNKDNFLLIENYKIREKLVLYYSGSSQLLDFLMWQLGVINEAEAKYRSKVYMLKIQQPEWDDNTVNIAAAFQVQSECIYYMETNQNIEEQKNKLLSYKSDIQDILANLSTLKQKKFWFF